MELILTNRSEPLLCLNMIVKNESHIIKNTLTNLLKKVKFDYWVISDTGSTDNTKELITKFFKEVDIPGELYEDEWKDFGHNRTIALEHAFGKSKYLMVFDADDEICGNFVLPELTKDSYHFQFGGETGTSYTRTQIVNNKKKWKYVGVLHEIITCTEETNGMEIITGDYFTVSGKSGSRSLDVNKYLKDAQILEKAYEEAIKNNDELYNRYGFYCANSYYDCGKHEDAIKWYKKTLDNKNWSQEKYVSCLRMYNCYNALNQKESGMFYLVKSAEYDKERSECFYELVSYYCCNGLYEIAYGYYTVIKSFYNDNYLITGLNNKLFLDTSKANLFLPYYMILVADKIKDYDTVIQMYKIIFTKKHIEHSKFFIGNMLYNLQFFIERVKDDSEFLQLFKGYVEFLVSINYPIYDHEFMGKYEKYGITITQFSEPVFSLEECSKSKNILIYTGHAPSKWNNSFSVNNALGGSETAISCLSKFLPKEYNVYVAGEVEEEKFDNIVYVNSKNLHDLIKTTAFHTIIISRYLNFYEIYKNFSAYQTFIWGHDITLYAYGTGLSVEGILSKWASKITGCICQTEWHKNLFLSSFPQLKDKISTINNGINADLFFSKDITKVKKVINRFVYTSCSERGLYKLVQLWPSILENLPDAELMISSYNNFPKSEEDTKIQEIINKTPSIKHMGKLNRTELYNLMASVEYWLYPSYFQETSCITSLELLASEVICLYYPVAGLVNTVGDYGIPISEGNELDALLSLSIKKKNELKRKGKEYALSCSWKNRATEWCNIFFSKQSTTVIKEDDQEAENYTIKIINLKKRTDRRETMETKLKNEDVNKYEFFEAINGKELTPTPELLSLFKMNDFNYKKGVMGCALSHIHLWNSLINDKDNDFYVILEDDIVFCNNFKNHLNFVCKLFVEQKLEHLALGEYHSSKQFPLSDSTIEVYSKDLYKEWNLTFAYIISKDAAKKAIDYINSCSIKCAIDNPQAFGYILKYSSLNLKLVHCEIVNEFGSDIQNDSNDNNFIVTPSENKEILTVSFCDWWQNEYCGGTFDVENNFLTNLLRKYGNNYDVKIVSPHESPDILFYSIFGYSHQNYTAKRKVFFSGEPYGSREYAGFNITFDRNSYKNTRVPLWLCYFSNSLLDENTKRGNNTNVIPNREKFCSFVATGPGLQNNRQEFVEKLSKYKKVDCGGSYLNNIGYNIPLGLNCSGKIEHNNNYKFAMAFESTVYPGYVTEKICDIFKSNCIPIYWGDPDIIKDFNPSSFINANDFANFDELVDYIIKVDADEQLYKSFFKSPLLAPEWSDILIDPNKTFFKNLADRIIGKNENLFDNFNSIYYNNSDYFLSNSVINNIKQIKTYSQASQDVFVINLLQHKKNGYFVEIGTNDPIEGNNTYILEKNYDFKGVLVEYESFYENSYKQHRPNSIYIIDDARNINYKKVLDDNKFPKNIDYLQIDLDVDNKSTLDTLILLDNTVFDTYKFATITFEHDIYRGNYFNTREISREIFKKRGYLLVFPDICTDQGCVGTGWQPFEDWYVHPDLVDMNLVNIIKTDKSLRHDHIRDIITNDSKNKPNILKSQEKMKIIFSNNCSVGDIYFSQPFIKNIVENNPENDYYFYHQTSSYYFTDILNIKDVNKDNEFKEYIYKIFNFKINLYDLVNIDNMSSYTYRYDKTNNILLICTWLGCLRQKYNSMKECDMISYNKTYKHFINDINTDLNISLIYDNKLSLDVYPCVPKLNIDKYREFIHSNCDKKIIFYYNFLPSSGQQFPVKNIEEHDQIISVLSESNIVVLTSKNTSFIGNKNIFFADDFLENVEYYDAKNFYYHAQMAYESDYSIYFDLGRGFMSMNKTFIEDNNSNIRIHITNNEYYYNSLNNNLLVPKNYMNLIKANNYIDIINKLNNVIQYNKFHGEIHNDKNIDEILRSYFPDYKYKGVFFEIGAYHPIEINNSYHFEKNGWDCYCFEANSNLIPELKKYRKNVFNYAISNENKDNINFQICLQDLKTCSFSAIEISEDYKNHFFYNPSEIINITVNQKTINSIIENEIQNLDKIDIVSLDIEGGELNCLYGFDLEKYKPKVLVIEDAFNNKILDEYMFKFGYKLDKHISYNKYYVYNK